MWDFRTITPLERPEEYTDREFLSQEEAALLEQHAISRNDELNEPSEVRTEPLPVGGNVGAYNNFWMDRGTRVLVPKTGAWENAAFWGSMRDRRWSPEPTTTRCNCFRPQTMSF